MWNLFQHRGVKVLFKKIFCSMIVALEKAPNINDQLPLSLDSTLYNPSMLSLCFRT